MTLRLDNKNKLYFCRIGRFVISAHKREPWFSEIIGAKKHIKLFGYIVRADVS